MHLFNSDIQLSKIFSQSRTSFTAARVIWTCLALGRRSSTATPRGGGRTQLRTRVQIDAKGVYLPRCSLRYAKFKPEANRLRGSTI